MARPKKGYEKNRPERVAFWVSEEIKLYLMNEAARRDVSMGDIANEAFEKVMRRHKQRLASARQEEGQ